MTITTNVIDVLPDGVITNLSFEAKDDNETVRIVSISRENVDKHFILDKVDIFSNKEELIERAIENVGDVLKGNGVENIEIETIDAKSNLLGGHSKRITE